MTRKEAAQILNISPHDDMKVVKQAFRKLAKQYHPDKNQDFDSKSMFIAIHEAYTYLCDVAEGKVREEPEVRNRTAHSSSHWNRDFNTYNYQHYSREDFERKYEEAKRRAAEVLEKESELIYQNVLHEYQKGWRKTFVKWFAPAAALIGILLFIDFFLPMNREIRMDSYVAEAKTQDGYFQYYHFGDRKVQIDQSLFAHLKHENLIASIYTKPIFKDVSSIQILTEHGSEYSIQPVIQAHYLFPLLHLLFFLPLISLFIEKAKFWFVFFVVYTNLYVLPSLFLIILYRSLFL